jgi:hypothetical protein
VQVAQEYMGDVDERITRMSTILPGGSTLRGGVCGILLGAVAAVGLKYGSVKRDGRGVSSKLGVSVNDFFAELTKEKYGTTDCRDIAKCDFNNPEEAKAFKGTEAQHNCAGLLADTVRFVLPLLDTPADTGS